MGKYGCSLDARDDISRHCAQVGVDCRNGFVSNTTMSILWLLAGYLCGSVSSAIVICRLLGHADPRTVGSGNPGTTNVLRHFGKVAAALTLVGDVAKGFIPVTACTLLGFDQVVVALTGVGALLGHLYPIFFAFKGGKGVATLIGVLLAFDPRLGIAFMACWISVAVLTRYSSLSALTATALSPAVGYLLGISAPGIIAIVIMGIFVFWRHHANIRKLINGTEDKIGGTRSAG